MIKPSRVVFISKKIEDEFNSLDENNILKKSILNAIRNLKENAFCGTQIQKKLIPKEYVKKYNINNLWKLNLFGGWRLLYTVVTGNKIEIISAVLEWSSHKNYEKIMKY